MLQQKSLCILPNNMRPVALTESAWRAQGPGQKNPDVSFDLGPQDTPVKVTLGRQQALDGGVSDDAQVRLHPACQSTDPVAVELQNCRGYRSGQLPVSMKPPSMHRQCHGQETFPMERIPRPKVINSGVKLYEHEARRWCVPACRRTMRAD